jgi:hypothetical protein
MPLLVEFILISTFSSKSPGVPPSRSGSVFGPTVFSGVLSPTMTPFSTRQNFGSPSQSWNRTAAGRRRTAAAAAGRRGCRRAAAALASSACFAARGSRARRGRRAGRQALAVEDVLEAGAILEGDRRDDRAAAPRRRHARSPAAADHARRPAAGCAVPAALRACSDRRYGSAATASGQCHGQHLFICLSFIPRGFAPRPLKRSARAPASLFYYGAASFVSSR